MNNQSKFYIWRENCSIIIGKQSDWVFNCSLGELCKLCFSPVYFVSWRNEGHFCYSMSKWVFPGDEVLRKNVTESITSQEKLSGQ